MNKTLGCDCPDWLPNMEKLEGPAIFEAVRMGRKDASGVYIVHPDPIKPMSYCAWCGSKLEEIIILDDRFFGPTHTIDPESPLDWSDAP